MYLSNLHWFSSFKITQEEIEMINTFLKVRQSSGNIFTLAYDEKRGNYYFCKSPDTQQVSCPEKKEINKIVSKKQYSTEPSKRSRSNNISGIWEIRTHKWMGRHARIESVATTANMIRHFTRNSEVEVTKRSWWEIENCAWLHFNQHKISPE